MRVFLSLAAAAVTVLAGAHAIEIGTSPPPTLKYSDFVFDGKTTYCYSVRESLAAAMFLYRAMDAEGMGDECPVQLSLEQTTTGAVNVNQNVTYKLTATVSTTNSSIFSNVTALERPVQDPFTNNLVQISRANLHACASSSVCDAFRDGNNSRLSVEQSANFTDGKAEFTPTLNFTSAGNYTVFAVVMLPGSNGLSDTARFVTYISTAVGSSGSGDAVGSEAPKVPSPGPASAALPSAIAGAITAGVTTVTSLLLLAFQ